jgi:NTE family protein
MEWIDEADGVFRGGGVKGLGLAGALLGFAEHKTKPVTKWKNVAGASAGAIIASYLATGHSAQEMRDLLQKTRFDQFMDFGSLGKLSAGWNLIRRHGAARGAYFRDWFDDVLGGATFGQVKTEDGKSSYLKLITVDILNREMLVLPDDLSDENGKPRYRDPKTGDELVADEMHIAHAARMSMSIPYVFEPIKLTRVDGQPALFMDGGTLSNFPVWLFDVDDHDPVRPTFGFTLTGGHGIGGPKVKLLTPWPVEYGLDITHTAMEAWDKRFVSHSTRVRTCAVDAGTIGTTQFNLTQQQQQWLVDSGRKAATDFLNAFNLDDYMNTFGRHMATPAAAPA